MADTRLAFDRTRTQYKSLKFECSSLNTKYSDPDFLACNASIVGDRRQEKIEKFAKCVTRWERPENVYVEGPRDSERWSLIGTHARAADIQQGHLGNCWIIAALAVIAERRDLVGKIFVTRKYNEQGIYGLQLFIDGSWRGVIVDDRFPCDKYRRMVFSRCVGKQIWVPLVEKAMAKVFGSYGALQSGHLSDGLNYLTGFTSERIDFTQEPDRELLFAKLLSFYESEFLMGAHVSTYDEDVQADLKRKGLITNHVYSVLKVVCMDNNRLVQLRNPWGNFSWNGDWSDHDQVSWNERLSAYLSPHRSGEGIFWMGFNEFVSIFTGLEVCKVRNNWFPYSGECLLPPYADASCQFSYKFACLQSTQLDISIYQSSKRGDIRLPQTDIGFILLSKSFEDLKPIEFARSKRSRMLTRDLIVEAGEYYIVPFSFGHWTDKVHDQVFYQICVSVHSSRELTHFEGVSQPNLLTDAIISSAKYFGDRRHYELGVSKHLVSSITLDMGCGYATILENYTPNKFVEMEVNISTGDYVSTRGAFWTRDVIPPQHCQVVNMITQTDSSKCSRFNSAFQLRLCDRKSPLCTQKEPHVPQIGDAISQFHLPRKNFTQQGGSVFYV